MAGFRLRYANSGPEAKPDGAGSLLGDFATVHRRAAAGATYTAPGLLTPHEIRENPAVPDTSALLSMPLPSGPAPDGYKWSLQAQFSGLPLQVTPASSSTRVDIQQQYQTAADTWVPLSPSGSGTYSNSETSPEGGEQLNEYPTVSLLALRDLEDFDLDEGATVVSVRVAWGVSTGTGGSATFNVVDEPIGDLEANRFGWDWSLAWVLRRATDPS